jgi:hypothetical protein
LKIWASSNGRFDWLNRFDNLSLFIKSHVESRDVSKKITKHLYDLRFSRRFVLVRLAYLSSSQAHTNNRGVFGKEHYLPFDWWKHFMPILRRSKVTINLTRPLKKMQASEFFPLLYYIVILFSDAPSPCGFHPYLISNIDVSTNYCVLEIPKNNQRDTLACIVFHSTFSSAKVFSYYVFTLLMFRKPNKTTINKYWLLLMLI